MKKIERIYVDPSFKKLLKKMAAEQSKSMLKLTKELGVEEIDLSFEGFKRKKKDVFRL